MPGTISLADRSSVGRNLRQLFYCRTEPGLCDNRNHREEITLGRFRFGLFEFDVASRELRREGALRRLQSQPA
jgi:hypothetical protein